MYHLRIIALPLTLLLGACVDGGQGSGSDVIAPIARVSLEAATEEAVDNAALVSSERFLSAAISMQEFAEEFCAAPNVESLESVQDAWRNAVTTWYRQSLYNFGKFGPLRENPVFEPFTFIDSLRIRGRDYTSEVRGEIAADIASSRDLTDAYFAGKTFQRVGLLALESVLFETSTPDRATDADAVLADYTFSARKCDVLSGLAGQIVSRAEGIQNAWVVDYAGTGEPFRSLFLAGEFSGGAEPITDIFSASQQFLDYLKRRRVVEKVGQIADFSWEPITATIDEVELLLRGADGADNSIFAVMAAGGNQNEIADVESSIAQVREAIANRDIDMLAITLGFLDGNFKREIPDSLGVELGDDFGDGD